MPVALLALLLQAAVARVLRPHRRSLQAPVPLVVARGQVLVQAVRARVRGAGRLRARASLVHQLPVVVQALVVVVPVVLQDALPLVRHDHLLQVPAPLPAVAVLRVV